jgi:hypothetical protein
MDRLSWRLPLLLTLPPPCNFSKFCASRLATPFTPILLMETCSSDKGFGLVARPLLAGRVEGTEDRHPTIYDSALCDVRLVAVLNDTAVTVCPCLTPRLQRSVTDFSMCDGLLHSRHGLLWLMSLVIAFTLHAICSSTFVYKFIHLKYSG